MQRDYTFTMANRDQAEPPDSLSGQCEFPFEAQQYQRGDGTNEKPIRRFIRLREVLHRTGLGRSTVYRWMDEGRFPKSVRLGGRSVAWIEHEIDEWLQDRCK